MTDIPVVQATLAYQPRKLPSIWRQAKVMSDGQKYIDPHDPTGSVLWVVVDPCLLHDGYSLVKWTSEILS